MSSFLAFSQIAQSVGAISSRLEKARILGEYFAPLDDADLRRAALYLGGHLFPLRESRSINVGGAALFSAIQSASGADETWLRERLVARGDAGDVAGEAFDARAETPLDSGLQLGEIEAQIESLSLLSGKAKTLQIGEFLRKMSALEAKFFCKMLAGDLRIGLKEGAVEDAIARLAQQPISLVQRANMLSGDLGEVALLARHGNLESAKFALFHPLKFMLATPAADLDDVARQMPDSFVVEDKFDGIRAQVHIAPHREGDEILHGEIVSRAAIEHLRDFNSPKGTDSTKNEGNFTTENGDVRVALFSRTLDEITGAFPDLLAPLAALLPDFSGGIVLDGEIVPLRGDQIAPFQELQKRLGRKKPTKEITDAIPVAFIAYDALFANEILLETPFFERRAVLESLHFSEKSTRLAVSNSCSDVALLDAQFDAARARGNEGLMIKDPRALYNPGRRGRQWLKIKKTAATLDVVVTSVESGSGRRAKFYSDYTFAVRASETDDTLLNVGKAYSGLTDAEITALSAWFIAHTTQVFAHGRVRMVEPQIVLEITFDRVQSSPRHKSGFALRFPRILRIRDGKPAGEVDTLETVRQLAQNEFGAPDDSEREIHKK